MKDVWSMNDKYFQHEFGCGIRVRFEKVEFSDGLKIWIPREKDGSVHDCPKLPNGHEDEDWNEEVFMPEDPVDYDEWVSQGNEEWSYEKLLPYFRKLETDLDFQDDFHGTKGPIMVRRNFRENF